MGTYKYKAFISYSHKDDRWGRWLHRRLETYPLPRNIVGNVTETGKIPKRLKPIFRDREELAAADNLGDKIEQALEDSENLIMICSPAAARSHWVNQEILYFKRHNRGAQIFSVIVEGEPFASNMPGREAEECFPPALRYQLDEKGDLSNIPAEPLAADLRDHADGKRLGVLKLVSGMIGVGLDEVVQRDMKRTRRRVTTITTGALATVLMMGTLTGFAVDARQEAEQRRNDAEGQIEFMLTDLKEKLESVGRLDALQAVGDQAASYYDQYPAAKHDDDALGRRARVFHYLGEIQDSLGNFDDAGEYFSNAYQATEKLLNRNPNDPEQLFNHAQSAYWAGYIAYKRENLQNAEKYFQLYLDLAKAMKRHAPHNSKAQIEVISAATNLGILRAENGYYSESIEIYSDLIPTYENLIELEPNNLSYQEGFENLYGWMANAARKLGDIESALFFRGKQSSISVELKKLRPNNQKFKYNFLTNALAKVRLHRRLNNFTIENTKVAESAHTDAVSLHNLEPSNADWALLVLRLKYELLFCYQNLNEPYKLSEILSDIEAFEANYPNIGTVNQKELSDLKNIYMDKPSFTQPIEFTQSTNP